MRVEEEARESGLMNVPSRNSTSCPQPWGQDHRRGRADKLVGEIKLKASDTFCMFENMG